MIPNPPLREGGELAVNRWTVVANLVGGILATCCTCHQTSITHWEHEGRYVPLHERCVDHLVKEWRRLLTAGEMDTAPPVERPMGAYARRAAARLADTGSKPVIARAVSVSLGSPYFIPGMPEGTPWVAVAEMPNDVPLVSPAGQSEAHARKVNDHWRASAERKLTIAFRGRLPLGGYVVDPTGARSGEWRADELASRAHSAKLAS